MSAEGEARVTILGGAEESGAYLLGMRAREPLALAFGRFRGGRPIPLPAGTYLYVGSAMGTKGASSLARRLVRHATRSGDRPAHTIRAEMIARFATAGLGRGDLRPRSAKSLFWHVDYLLDPLAVSLTHVLAVRAPGRLEATLARLVADRPYTEIPVPGLGASDTRDGTHLFSATPAPGWWTQLVEEVRGLDLGHET